MTPAPIRGGFLHVTDDDSPPERRREPTAKAEAMKQIFGMLLAGLVAYFATVYGLQERIKVLEVRLDYAQQKAEEARSEVRALSAEVREVRDAVQTLSSLTRSRRP